MTQKERRKKNNAKNSGHYVPAAAPMAHMHFAQTKISVSKHNHVKKTVGKQLCRTLVLNYIIYFLQDSRE